MPFSERMSDNDLQKEIAKAKQRNPVTGEAIYNAGGTGKDAIVDEINKMAQSKSTYVPFRDIAEGKVDGSSGGSGGNAGGNSGSDANPYADQLAQLENVYSRYMEQIAAQERAAAEQKAAEQAARKEQYNLSRNNVNTAADDALRQAYIRKRQQMQQMPQQNALMGNGGLSETALLQLEADYGNNRANLEAERLAQLGNLETQLNEGLAIDEGNYYARLQNIQQRQAEADMERELAMVEAANKAANNNASEMSLATAEKILSVNPNHAEANRVYMSNYEVPYTAKSAEDVALPDNVREKLEEAYDRYARPGRLTLWEDFLNGMRNNGFLTDDMMTAYTNWLKNYR